MLPKHRFTQGEEPAWKVPLLLDGVAVPIAEWSLELTVDSDPNVAGDALYIGNAGNGCVEVYDATTWIARIPAAITSALAPGFYHYAYRATSLGGVPQVIERGLFFVDPKLS
jgi:hypothetical protein